MIFCLLDTRRLRISLLVTSLIIIWVIIMKAIHLRKTSSSQLCSRNQTQPLPNGSFCLSLKDGILTGGLNLFDGKLCRSIEVLVQNSSIVDFGAGLGHYGRCFLREAVDINIDDKKLLKGYELQFRNQMRSFNIEGTSQKIISYEGYDGSVNIEEITNSFVKQIDLSVQFDLKKRFDWVISLDVGEHIPKEAEDIYLQNLITHACKGIILSWAIPGRNGYGHISNQPNEYIQRKMEQFGYLRELVVQKYLREESLKYWFKDSLMVFYKSKVTC